MHYITDVLKKSFVFKGRTGREEYWMFMALWLSFMVAFSMADEIFGLHGVLKSLLLVLTYITVLSLNVRRLHDLGISGYWIIPAMLPLKLGLLLVLVCACKGNEGENKYGEAPISPSQIRKRNKQVNRAKTQGESYQK